ncbi:type II secretion system F family protein [Aestuariivirga sp. YIM B02566]|uniref:Type II secretion system F family protein n=1 Tax=Taklimakanibacter albus TaxID=2800327 RepID=A0ACC5RES3_9HYPH|nr:type II secretion system F family protein [Aestuariivirga sp. YIM B02566]MBK1870908.1 type II secretion system F family protein [Aestuariivirga sp. YIM B02566]
MDLEYFMKPEGLITLLVGLSAFATILTIAAPLLQGDQMKARMKGIATERERLRAAHRATLSEGARLRDRAKPGLISQLVEGLNLRKVFEAETSRESLRQAGYRSDNHLVYFLAARAVMPIALATIFFVYSVQVFGDSIPSNMRFAAMAIGLVAGFYLPSVFIRNKIGRRQLSIKRAWSDALDLLLICVESGMSIEAALQRVSREIGSQSVPLAEELTLTCAELSYLPDRRKAFENLGKRTGLPIVKSVVTSLIQSERYGTPLGQALRVLAQENRDMRMAEAEKKAAGLPPKLTVPMILFFLPVIFVVILGPSMILVLAANK